MAAVRQRSLEVLQRGVCILCLLTYTVLHAQAPLTPAMTL